MDIREFAKLCAVDGKAPLAIDLRRSERTPAQLLFCVPKNLGAVHSSARFFQLGTRQYAKLPSGNWFPMPFALEELLTARHLRLFPIANLEPGAVVTIRDVWICLPRGNDSSLK